MRNFQYALPLSVDEAAKQAQHSGAVLKAAGTDLLDLMKGEVLAPDVLVNLRGMPGLDRIERQGDGFSIGALVTLADIAAHRDLPPTLRQAAGETATPQIRNMATLAGSLCQRPRCWYFRNQHYPCLKKGGATCFAQEGENKFHAIFDNKPCAIVHPSNTATALMALVAEVITNKREIPIDEFFVPARRNLEVENVLERGEVITKVVVKNGLPAGAYREAREKQAFDWALVAAAVSLQLDRGTVRAARIALGSVASTPYRRPEVEAALVGKKLSEKVARTAAELAFVGATPYVDNAYKVPMGKVILKRAILGAGGLPEMGGA